MAEHTRLHRICLLHWPSIRLRVKSQVHQLKPSPTRPTPCGRTTPTATRFRGTSRLKSLKTAMATVCPTNCRAIMIQPTLMHLDLWKTSMTTTTDFPIQMNLKLAPIRSILILTATVCVTDLWLRHQTALLDLTPSRLTLLAIPTQTATACQTRSILLRTATLLWKKTWMTTVTVLMTSMKQTRALPTVTLTPELTHSTLIPTTTEFVTDQSMSMTLKATSFALLDLTTHRLAKLLKGLCMA